MISPLSEASDPATAPERLEQLAREFPAEAIQEAITANPNAPLSLLFSLAPRFPAQFTANPLVPLALLDNPRLFEHASFWAMNSILRQGHPSEEILRGIALCHARTMALPLASCPGAPTDVLDMLPELHDLSEGYTRAMAAHPNLSEARLLRYTMAADPETRRLAAVHPRCPRGWLALLRRAGALPGLSGIGAPGGDVAEEELRRLIEAGQFGRELVASYPGTPPALLDLLIPAGPALPEEERGVRVRVASNPRTSPQTLERLLGWRRQKKLDYSLPALQSASHAAGRGPGVESDAEVEVRLAVARHLSTPEAALRILSTDASRDVRAAVALHPSIRPASLTDLALDHDPVVVCAALRNPLLEPEAIAAALRRHDAVEVALLAARHPRVLPSDLASLCRRGARAVRLEALAHPAVPAAILGALADDADVEVRRAVARHPQTPAAILERLVALGSAPSLDALGAPSVDFSGDALRLESRGGFWRRYLAAHHPRSPDDVLVALASDDDEPIREAACRALSGRAAQAAAPRLADPAPQRGFFGRLWGRLR